MKKQLLILTIFTQPILAGPTPAGKADIENPFWISISNADLIKPIEEGKPLTTKQKMVRSAAVLGHDIALFTMLSLGYAHFSQVPTMTCVKWGAITGTL